VSDLIDLIRTKLRGFQIKGAKRQKEKEGREQPRKKGSKAPSEQNEVQRTVVFFS
jgi:hypothetical protein